MALAELQVLYSEKLEMQEPLLFSLASLRKEAVAVARQQQTAAHRLVEHLEVDVWGVQLRQRTLQVVVAEQEIAPLVVRELRLVTAQAVTVELELPLQLLT